MDYSETIVEKYLKYKEFRNIIYEPDGNIPPDFLVNGKIAIEVRRLNQNLEKNGKTFGLEETAIPLYQKINKLFKGYKRRNDQKTLFFAIRFSRPILKWSIIKEKIKEYIDRAKSDDIEFHREYEVSKNFLIEFSPSSKSFDELFIPGAYSDGDAGGCVVSEMLKNLKICIQDKGSKIEKVKTKYPEWWLVMIDYIGYGLKLDDQMQLRQYFNVVHEWDKIILIDPLNIECEFEI